MAITFWWNKKNLLAPDLETITFDVINYAIEELAINRAIELHANVISACEFKWLKKGKFVVDEGYYLLNVRPNKNETATVLWHKAITNLFRNGKTMLFQNLDGELFVADTFSVNKALYFDDTFNSITSRDINIASTFKSSDVIYLELDEKTHQIIIDHLNKLGNIVNFAIESYRQSNSRKLTFEMGADVSRRGIGNDDVEEETKNKAKDYVEKLFKSFFNSFNSITPLQPGEKLNEVASQTGKSVDEITKAFNTIFETVAISFGIPIDIFMGKTTEKSNALNDWITTKLKYLFEQLTDSMNHAIVKKADYLKGERIMIDTTKIKHRDLLDSANDIDKLHSNGFTLNEIFNVFGLPPDTEDKNTDKRFFTKNQDLSENIQGKEGSE